MMKLTRSRMGSWSIRTLVAGAHEERPARRALAVRERSAGEMIRLRFAALRPSRVLLALGRRALAKEADLARRAGAFVSRAAVLRETTLEHFSDYSAGLLGEDDAMPRR